MRIAKDDVEEKDFPRFSLARECTLGGAPIITRKILKYLAALLNSNCAKRYFKTIVPILDNGGYQISQQYVESLPISKIPAAEQLPFIRLVDCILASKASNPSADVTDWEKEIIDRLVYFFYGLTTDEIVAVEGKA